MEEDDQKWAGDEQHWDETTIFSAGGNVRAHVHYAIKECVLCSL